MELSWMLAPAVACLVMALALGWLGLHVLQRGVIFVDLALAQVAALGTTYAVFLGHDPEEPVAYAIGLSFTIIGAVAFALVRRFDERVPQEALIGVAYVVCAATGAVLLDFAEDPHGAEKLQHLLVGNVVWVTWTEIATMVTVIGVVGLVHYAIRKPLLLISFDLEEARRQKLRLAFWDLVFYLSFGLVITALVHVAGVLLIFSYLIIPAVIARLFADGIGQRLALAWLVAIPVSLAGIAVSYEYSAGPIIVAGLGAVLLVALVVLGVRGARSPVRAAGALALSVGGIGALLWAFSLVGGNEHEHAHEEQACAAVETAAADTHRPPAAADPMAREAWYRAHASDAEALVLALHDEEDESLRLLVASALARLGDARALPALARLAGSELPFLRMEADDRLRVLAGEQAPAFDPLAGADEQGLWASWAAAPTPGWEARAEELSLP